MREFRRTLLEALILVIAGLVLGLSINAVNDDGITLMHQNFPKRAVVQRPTVSPLATSTGPGETHSPQASAPANETEAKLQTEGIGVAHHADVKAMLADPLFNITLFLIDARDDEHYQAGHIAGSHQIDHYHLDRFLPKLLPLLQPAQKVIIYCNGGHCEDSKMTALELINNGVSASNVFVYTGGYQDWVARHEPLEKGEAGSGISIFAAPQ